MQTTYYAGLTLRSRYRRSLALLLLSAALRCITFRNLFCLLFLLLEIIERDKFPRSLNEYHTDWSFNISRK
jgi:hypothetical protein